MKAISGLGGIGLVMFARWWVWWRWADFGWCIWLVSVVPWTGLVESKELRWYLDCLGNKLGVWVVSVWFWVVLG